MSNKRYQLQDNPAARGRELVDTSTGEVISIVRYDASSSRHSWQQHELCVKLNTEAAAAADAHAAYADYIDCDRIVSQPAAPATPEPNTCYNCDAPIADDAEACAACWVDPTLTPVAPDVSLSEAEAAYRAADVVWAGLYRAGGAARGRGDSAWVRELDRMRLAAFAVVEATFDAWQATLARTAA